MQFSRTLSDIMQMMTLSVVIPAYNEERRLPSTLDAIFAWLNANSFGDAQILVVDDGSRDNTANLVAERAKSDPRLRLVKNPGNRGKGYAVRHGMMEAQGDWILMSDADLSAPITELPKLVEAAAAKNVTIAIGSRALDFARSSVCIKATAVNSPVRFLIA